MASGQLGQLIQHLRSYLGAQTARTSTDGELLHRFASQGEQQAYATLVERYAPLVVGVCRRVLQDEHAAEDAFQATFLVLWRKASSLDGRGSIANWLYTVAYHLALKAKIRADQRRAHERQVPAMPDVETQNEPVWNELRPLLDEELERLPPKYRSPMVLCYLAGKTNEQAAQELGWTKDTVRGRLAKARELLRARLARRGVTVASTALAAVLADNAAQAVVPAAWMNATLQTAALLGAGSAAGISGSVLALANSFLRDTLIFKVKLLASLCLVASLTTGAGISIYLAKNAATAGRHNYARHGSSTPSAPIEDYDPTRPYIVEPVKDCPEDMEKEESDDGMSDSMEASREPDLEPPSLPPVQVRRRNWACAEELSKQLLLFPELALDADAQERALTQLLLQRAREPGPGHATSFTPGLLTGRPDLAGLPFRQGTSCQLSEAQARDLQKLSRELRAVLGEFLGRPNGAQEPVEPDLLGAALRKNFQAKTKTFFADDRERFRDLFRQESAVATLMQMLPAEQNKELRLVLVEQLATIAHRSAGVALARLALFDIAPEVRAEAIRALAVRPAEEYRPILLAGFRYPWAPVADHAAEALVALEDRAAVPALRRLAQEPDPSLPFRDPEEGGALVVREVVRVNHFRNCMMCHAASTGDKDMVRGPVPEPDKPLPPFNVYYREPTGDLIVRADVTYLRQDFSVAQPVEQAGPWPAMQRYDYLVRNRPLTSSEYFHRTRQAPLPTYPQREAVLYALKELERK
jgi:RNA polymerase sigma factor (sigma-70 family)